MLITVEVCLDGGMSNLFREIGILVFSLFRESTALHCFYVIRAYFIDMRFSSDFNTHYTLINHAMA